MSEIVETSKNLDQCETLGVNDSKIEDKNTIKKINEKNNYKDDKDTKDNKEKKKSRKVSDYFSIPVSSTKSSTSKYNLKDGEYNAYTNDIQSEVNNQRDNKEMSLDEQKDKITNKYHHNVKSNSVNYSDKNKAVKNEKNDENKENKKLKQDDNTDVLNKPFNFGALNLPQKNEETQFKVNTTTPRTKDKQKMKFANLNFAEHVSKNDTSQYSSSLPPSSFGDKVVNISAIEIDKNDISFYASPRDDEKNQTQESHAQEDQVFRHPGNSLLRVFLKVVFFFLIVVFCSAMVVFLLTRFS